MRQYGDLTDISNLTAISGTLQILSVDAATEARIRLMSSGIPQWRIDNAGGTFRITDDTAGTSPFVLVSGSATNTLVMQSDNVGIGKIPSVAFKLDVAGDLRLLDSSGTTDLILDTGAPSMQTRIMFKKELSNSWSIVDDATGTFIITDRSSGPFTDVIVIQQDGAANKDMIRIGSGTMGIGTGQTGGHRLVVFGDSRVKSVDVAANLFIDSGASSIQDGNVTFQDRGDDKWTLRKDNNNAFVLFDEVTSETAISVTSHADNENAIVVSSGSIGIGAAPNIAFKLDVAGTGRFDGDLAVGDGTTALTQLNVNADTEVRIRLLNSGAGQWWLDNLGGNFRIVDEVTGTAPVLINLGSPSDTIVIGSTGDVGIGGAPGAFKLDVAGTGRFDGDLTVGDGTNTNQKIVINSDTLSFIAFKNSGVSQWRLDNLSGNFRFVDEVNGTAPVTIAAGAGNNAINVNNIGNVGIGAAPAFKLDVKGDVMRLKSGTDDASTFIIDSGLTTRQNATLSFRDNGALTFILRSEAGGNFVLKDNIQNHDVMTVVPDAANANLLHMSGGLLGVGSAAAAGVKLDVRGSVFRLVNASNELAQIIIDSGASTRQTSSLSFRDRGTLTYSLTADSAGNFVLKDDINTVNVISIIPNVANATAIAIAGGKTGIGKFPGSFQLDVAGAGNFDGVVTGVTPTLDAHLATKAYVDDAAGGAWTVISGTTIADDATVDINLTGSFSKYRIELKNIIPITNDRELWLRMSLVGDANFLSGASDYGWAIVGRNTSGNYGEDDNADAQIKITRAGAGARMGTAAGESLNGTIYIHNADQNAVDINLTGEIVFRDSSGRLGGHALYAGLAASVATANVDAVQFLASTGNLNTGQITLYGLSG